MTAGDIYFAALREWFDHGSVCALDECHLCVLLVNRARLAQHVWRNSQHQVVTPPKPGGPDIRILTEGERPIR